MQRVPERTSPASLDHVILRRTQPLVRPRRAHQLARRGEHRETVASVNYATGDVPVVTRSDREEGGEHVVGVGLPRRRPGIHGSSSCVALAYGTHEGGH